MSREPEFEADKEMNLTGHLSELRNRLIVTAVFFVLFFIVGLFFVEDIFSFFRNDIDFVLNITSPWDTIQIFLTLAGLIAITGTLPILCFQAWIFVKPGLTVSERRASLPYIPAIFILFILGMVFGYLIFIKLILPFLLSLNDGLFNEIFTVDKYFGFLFRVTFPFGLLFEIPIIAMFLTSLGILTPQFMRKSRKYAYFILIIVGVVITPPDFILQIVIAIPLLILYELSVSLSAIVYRRKQRKHREFMGEIEEEEL